MINTMMNTMAGHKCCSIAIKMNVVMVIALNDDIDAGLEF